MTTFFYRTMLCRAR